MAADLQELRDRLEYCSNSLKPLFDMLRETAAKLIDVNVEYLDLNQLIVTATLTGYVPVSIRSSVGMIANELRAILDGLACVLAFRNSHNVNGTYFPITKDAAIFDHSVLKKLKNVSASDVEKIRKLKPWANGHPILFPLHEADRVRKHQRLLSCAPKMDVGMFEGAIGEWEWTAPLLLTKGIKETILRAKNCNIEQIFERKIIYGENQHLIGREVGEFLHDSIRSTKDILELFS